MQVCPAPTPQSPKFALQCFSDSKMEDTLVRLEQACIDGVLHQYVLEIVHGIGAVSLFVHELRLNELIQSWLPGRFEITGPVREKLAVL